MMTWWLALVVLVGGGSSNELLDMVPTDMYWRMQKVEVSTAAMLGHLKAPEAGDVGGLLEELGSDQYKVRMGAQKKLLAMGPGIIDRIRPALKSPDAEVAMRVKEIIAALSARQGQGSIRRLMAIRTLGEMKSKNRVQEAVRRRLRPAGDRGHRGKGAGRTCAVGQTAHGGRLAVAGGLRDGRAGDARRRQGV